MKLSIGDNIRKYRKHKDMTQEQLADRLGVSYQSVSRWENGTTYPDIELLPSIAEMFCITMDELMGIPDVNKEKQAERVFDELRRECMKWNYDAEHIVELIRDIRRNYVNSGLAWRPWSEGNGRAFRDPKILPEVRLMAEAYLERHPMNPHALETMTEIEDEEHLGDFLDKYTTSFDCSERALLFNRYFRRRDAERFEPERRYQLYQAFNTLLCSRYLLKWGEGEELNAAANRFMETMLSIIRCDAVDDRPDMWIQDRVELGLKSAMCFAAIDKIEDAIARLESVVSLLEETMKIADEVLLPTSCRFLEGMEWRAKEDWSDRDNNPDSPKERIIYIATQMNGMCSCYCIFPSRYFDMLRGNEFEPLHSHSDFEKLCDRVKALIVTKPPQSEE